MKENANRKMQPPAFASKLFEWVSNDAFVEDVLGDLEEVFYSEVETKSVFRAKLNYWVQILYLTFSNTLRKRKRDASLHPLYYTQQNTAMLKNYLKVALRSLYRNKFFTIINVLGLALGMSVTILYIGFLNGIYSYDKFHENYNNIFRIVSQQDRGTESKNLASSPPPLAESLKEDFLNDKNIVTLNNWISGSINFEGKELSLHGYFTQPSFFDLFSFKVVKGNPQVALTQPYKVMLTEKAAKKVFGKQDPMGKVITFGTLGDFEVAGIIADIPKGSHLSFEVLASYQTAQVLENLGTLSKFTEEWENFRDHYTYVHLEDKKVKGLKHLLAQYSNSQNQNNAQSKISFQLQPLDNIATSWIHYSNDITPYFGGGALILFGIITMLILVPACFNYINISISRSIRRAKEIGVRKVVGARKQQIKYQFIVETVIICLIALIGSVWIFTLIKGRFVDMIIGGDSLNFSITFTMVIYFIVFAIFTGVMSGIMPALYFSKIHPILALKGSGSLKIFGRTNLKKALLVFQFSLSLFFIVGVVVQFRQFYHKTHFDLGFQKENLIDVNLQNANRNNFKNEFSKLASVKNVSMSSHILGVHSLPKNYLHFTDREDSLSVREMFIDENYIENLGLELLEGYHFKNQLSSTEEIIVNETFCEFFGFESPKMAIGQTFVLEGETVTIIGVVKDFHYSLLKFPISSFMFRQNPQAYQFANLKVASQDYYTLFSSLENTWDELQTGYMLEAKFFDRELDEAFSTYTTGIKMFGFLGLMAIAISCLGLLGMVVYSTETRLKEVGVRKVMGATVNQLIILLSKEYLKILLISAFIALPISYFFFDFILTTQQHYSVQIGILELVLSLLILLVLGVLTLSTQTIKATLSNPTKTLRNE